MIGIENAKAYADGREESRGTGGIGFFFFIFFPFGECVSRRSLPPSMETKSSCADSSPRMILQFRNAQGRREAQPHSNWRWPRRLGDETTCKSWSLWLAASDKITMKNTAGSPLQSFPSVQMTSLTCGRSCRVARLIADWNRACWENAAGTCTILLSRLAPRVR